MTNWVLFLLIYIFSPSANAMIQSIAVTKNNEPCEVHFFERWTGYAHPVKLIGPLDLATAFNRRHFERAWTCKKGTQTLFVLLEGIEITGLEANAAPLSGDLKFYATQKSPAGLVKGLPISEGEMILAKDFFIESFRDGIVTQSVLIHQNTTGKFEYQYNADGKLSLLRVTNLLGDINELKY